VTTPSSGHRSTARRRARARKPRNDAATAATRVDILKSAAKAFRRLGYHGATVQQIAAALRMKKGNLYYYFKSKEDLLFACHQYSLDRLTQLLADVEAEPVSPETKLRRLIHGAVHLILDELHGTALFLDLEALSATHLRAIIAQRDLFDKGVRALLDEGTRRGDFTEGNAKFRSFVILGAVNWIPRWFNPGGTSTSDEIAQQFADYLLDGLRR